MNILIPMAGDGSRFSEKGFVLHKPILPLTSRHNHQIVPLVVAAVHDLPVDIEREDVNLLFIIRDFHVNDGIDQELLAYFPRAKFIAIDALGCESQAVYYAVDFPLTSMCPSKFLYIIEVVSNTFFERLSASHVSPIFAKTFASRLSFGVDTLTLCCHFLR